MLLKSEEGIIFKRKILSQKDRFSYDNLILTNQRLILESVYDVGSFIKKLVVTTQWNVKLQDVMNVYVQKGYINSMVIIEFKKQGKKSGKKDEQDYYAFSIAKSDANHITKLIKRAVADPEEVMNEIENQSIENARKPKVTNNMILTNKEQRNVVALLCILEVPVMVVILWLFW